MRKRILLVTLLVSVLGIVLLSVLFTDVFYRQSIEAVNGQLQIYMDVYAAERQGEPLTQEGAEAFAAELRGVRVTFLAADGLLFFGLFRRKNRPKRIGGAIRDRMAPPFSIFFPILYFLGQN